jgi:hypothetical protein
VHETCSMGQGSFHLPLSLPTRSTWQPVCNNCPGWYSVKESTRGRRGITCHVYMPRLQKEARKKEEEKHISFLKVVQRYGITASSRHTHGPHTTTHHYHHTHHHTNTTHTTTTHTTTPPHHHTTTPPQPHFPYVPLPWSKGTALAPLCLSCSLAALLVSKDRRSLLLSGSQRTTRHLTTCPLV